MNGVIVNLLINKGYGFVRGTDNIQRFVHRRAFMPPESFDTACIGQGVTFTPMMHPEKGERADEVVVRSLDDGNR
jgi:cold shock CspA family protein